MPPPQPTARLMLKALRGFEIELQQRLAEDGFGDVSVAQSNLLRHLDAQGMRLGDLAADAGISKQAASQGVRQLESSDLVRIEPDPDDRRAKRVHYTQRGLALVQAAVVHVKSIERQWERQLGTKRYKTLRAALAKLDD